MSTDRSTTDPDVSNDASDDHAGTQAANDRSDGDVTGHDRLLLKGALGLLSLLAIVATVRLYLSVSNAIGLWVTREFRPLAQAGFNLVVLLLVGAGLSWVLRKLHRS